MAGAPAARLAMIESAVSHIAGQLNQYLKRNLDLTEDIVVVSSLLEQDGTVANHVNNKLVVFLVNIEKETATQRRPPHNGGGPVVVGYPPIYLNLFVMVAAHFASSNYTEALKFLSKAVSFFQSRPVLDHSNSPDLDPEIQRLVLDIENLGTHDLSNLWGVLSGRYLPSVLYRVRMVAFDSDDVRAQVPTVRQPDPSVGV